jgi:sarcosine oxidase
MSAQTGSSTPPPRARAPEVLVAWQGGMGPASVRHLAACGVWVLGIERFTQAHNRGSSHGRAYVSLLLRAYGL